MSSTGLDMYLRAEQYVSGYDFRGDEDVARYRAILAETGLKAAADPETPGLTVSVTVAYWRKANQIHNWFVQNVQGGEDECKPHYVSREQLQELLDGCKHILGAKKRKNANAVAIAEETFPPVSGFFFGSNEIDEWYWEDIESTVTQLERVLANTPDDAEFQYQSSW